MTTESAVETRPVPVLSLDTDARVGHLASADVTVIRGSTRLPETPSPVPQRTFPRHARPLSLDRYIRWLTWRNAILSALVTVLWLLGLGGGAILLAGSDVRASRRTINGADSDPRLKSWERAKLRRQVAELRLLCQHPDCVLPGVPIDYTPRRRGELIRPEAYVLDEIVARVHGGDPLDPANVRPAHHLCNARHGAALTNGTAAAPRPAPRTSRDW